MKKENVKKILCCVVLLALWLLPCFELEIFTKTYIYFAAFVPSVAVMYIFKKEWLSILLMAIITAAVSAYNFEYIFVVLPVVLLIYAHFSLSCTEEKKDESFNLGNNCTTLAFVCIVGEVFYAFVQYSNIEPHRIENVFTALKLLPLFLAFFTVLTLQGRKKENYKAVPKKKADKYVMLYITSLLGLLVSLFTFHALNGYGIQSIRTEYVFWFIFVMTMAVNKDPYIEMTLDGIKKRVERIKVSNK